MFIIQAVLAWRADFIVVMSAEHSFAKLYAITPAFSCVQDLLKWAEAICHAGVDMLQYRSKTDDVTRLQEAKQLMPLCRAHRVPLIINDSMAIADAVQADGVHLGQGDGDVRQARALLGQQAIIGVTCHDQLHLAEQAKHDGADYVAFGAFFPSATKPQASLAKPELLRQAAHLGLPRCAIGGITPDNVGGLTSAGAEYIAIVSGLLPSEDFTVAQRVQAYRRGMTVTIK